MPERGRQKRKGKKEENILVITGVTENRECMRAQPLWNSCGASCVVFVCLPASTPSRFFSPLLYSQLARPAFPPPSHTLAAIYKGMPKFCATRHKRWMNDLLHLCDCVMRVPRGFLFCFVFFFCECIDAACAWLCEIWCKQNKLSCCSAAFFDVPSKNHHTNTLEKKTHSLCCALSSLSASLMFKWLSLASNTKVHIAENKSSSCKQHEIVIGEKKLPNITAGPMSKILIPT